MPVAPYVESSSSYFEALKPLSERAAVSPANLVLMGIEPTYPSEKYGYIIPTSKDNLSKVSMFKEKPTQDVAAQYIAQGALWNGGVFVFKLGYVLNRAHQLIDFTDYEDLFDKYETLTKINFDYAVVEHEPEIEGVRFAGTWADLGTWNTLTEALDSRAIGKAIFDETCENVHMVNERNVPILCMRLKNMVVSASPEGILVSDKEQSSYIKPFVNTLDDQIKFAEKSWGSFWVLDVQDGSMIIKVTLNPGLRMNYHSHQFRNEVWRLLQGKAAPLWMEWSKKSGSATSLPWRPTGKDYLWGGTRLNDKFTKGIDLAPLAETWECSTHPDGPSIVASGEFEGQISTVTVQVLRYGTKMAHMSGCQ